MLLETLDVKQNDIIIYSRNIFNFENNFKIIPKDELHKKARHIGYGEVCRYVNEFTPKSLIVYRILTNISDFSLSRSKYGFFVNISNVHELIYFDPILALKEMEEYINETSNFDLRFRIQQLGLTTLTRRDKVSNYAEIYSADLTAVEALNQDDKVFVDALLSIDSDEIEDKTFPIGKALNEKKDIKLDIKEDKEYNSGNLNKINQSRSIDKEPPDKKEAVSPPGSFGEFLKRKTAELNIKQSKSKDAPVVEIFRSTESLENVITNKKNIQIVLRLEKND
jgi:hypothetical protein